MSIVEVRPSDIKEWSQIDQTKAVFDGIDKNRAEWYGWYKSANLRGGGFSYYPHRKPTLEEDENDRFN